MFWQDLPPVSLDKIAGTGQGVQDAFGTPQISSKRRSALLNSPNSLGQPRCRERSSLYTMTDGNSCYNISFCILNFIVK